jgi:glutaminyl-peptide cyclotransferase
MRAGLAVAAALAVGAAVSAGGEVQPNAQHPVEHLRAEVVETYPHDRGAFTQGLVFDNGRLLESTGLVGQSSLREVELATGRVVRRADVPRPIFAEGLALVGGELIQLTWQSQQALRYDRRTFARKGEFTYTGEGWGLCFDGRHLVMSNGSAELSLRRPADFGVARTVTVTMDGRPLRDLNELECVDGAVYANVWQRDLIVRIDPGSGRVTARIDVPPLLSVLERQNVDVLNGIAYDPTSKTFLITGKLWPKVFRVKFVSQGR